MNSNHFQVTRIEVPDWARKPETKLYSLTLSEHESIQQHRDEILEIVHTEVAGYLNTEDRVYDGDEEGFPHRSEMTGEYYISDEMYEKHVGPVWFQIGIQTHFLEKQWMEGQTCFDYLGLEVWIKYDPNLKTFEIFRNTDSSSI